MLETEKGDTYFNYNDYAEIQGKFLKMFSYSNTFDSNFLEQALNELKVEPKREISFRNIFKELQKYLNQDGILGYDDGYRGCKYINYVLNDGFVKSNSNILHTRAFELFKEFEDKLRKHKNRGNHICDLYYISDDIYKKMKSLYGLYDGFISLKQKYNSVPDCQVLSAFVYLFKDFIRVINDNGCDIIKNKLTNFIDVIKKHKWATEEVCSNKLSEITSQKLDSSE
ncbi:hypothetical protein PVT01_000049800, partial [Plasmodium vivax]